MSQYTPPLRDMQFVLHEVLQVEQAFKAMPAHAELDADTINAVLEEGGKFASEVLFPLNREGDEVGCTLDPQTHAVTTPPGFADAYRQFVAGGWAALSCDPDYGGQGLPVTLNQAIYEMLNSANQSWTMYPGLTHGAYDALHAHGTPEQKATYLPKLTSGEWTGTMCLTEPHAGTDLGLLRSKAEPQGDGTYRITGEKIFISSGEHDMAENILHLVLARLPDAPIGSRGISLFIVPKFHVNADGSVGERNGIYCGAIEHKMGIHGNSTCQMVLDGAVGSLVGEPHKGLAAMFVMMNSARLGVGMQSLGLTEVAYQNAAAYAKDRTQSRALSGAKAKDKAADPIIVHPDVRRMLMIQRATSEGCRALAVWVARALDEQTHHPDPETRKAAEDLVGLMTPIVKALLTDIGFENANLGMQVLGGHGYIREHGMEQYVRDARIAQIYEGTNGIQALDLVGRKLGMNGGRALRRFFHPVSDYVTERAEDKDLAPFVGPLAKALGRLQLATAEVARKGMSNPDEAGAAATDYLRLFGLTALAYMWARMAEIAAAKVAAGEDGNGFYAAKLATAHFFMDRVLPQTGALFSQISAGATSMMALDEAAF